MIHMPGKANIPHYRKDLKQQLLVYGILLVVIAFCFSIPVWAQTSNSPLSILSTSDIKDKQPIPSQFARQSGNQIPKIQWQNVPTGTKSLAVTMTDPDAPNGEWVHWIAYNISAGATSISANSQNYILGINSWGNKGYDGPQPPSGTHHYTITVYALSKSLATNPALDYVHFQKAISDSVLASTQITGIYTH